MSAKERIAEKSKQRYAGRKAQGLCVACSQPPLPALPGSVYCQQHLETHRRPAYQKERSRKRYEEGLCHACPMARLPDSAYCQKHLDGINERNRRIREERRAASKCMSCGKVETEPGERCDKCKDKERATFRKARAVKFAKGLCTVYGCEEPLKPGRRFCQKHGADHATRIKQKRAVWLLEGKCRDCGGESMPHRLHRCEPCYLKTTAKQVLGDRSRWTELKDLHERQPICPYTGRRLTLGLDTSLDHIVPRCRGGSDDISNLQWVYMQSQYQYDVNTMKSGMLHEEYVAAIAEQYEYIFRKKD